MGSIFMGPVLAESSIKFSSGNSRFAISLNSLFNEIGGPASPNSVNLVGWREGARRLLGAYLDLFDLPGYGRDSVSSASRPSEASMNCHLIA